MNEFDYENMQKKRIASGAYHKKSGAKTKFVSLPSDNLTPSQLKKLNGPVKKFNIDQPMGWTEFKALAHDHQQLYISHIYELYKPSYAMLEKMFSVSSPTIINYFKCHAITFNKDIKYRPGEVQRAAWDAFCNGVVGGGDNVKKDNTPLSEKESDQTEHKEIVYEGTYSEHKTDETPKEESIDIPAPEPEPESAKEYTPVEDLNMRCKWSNLQDILAMFNFPDDAEVTINIKGWVK